jgi:HEAT repeat protein
MSNSNKNVVAVSVALSLAFVCGRGVRADEKTTDPAEEVLRQAKVGTDNASLRAVLETRSDSEADVDQIDRLIAQLGDMKFPRREEASRKLTLLGRLALPALRKGAESMDKEVARRSRDCIGQIERRARDDCGFLPRAAVRLLVARKAEGTVEALLRYLPFANDPELEEDIYYALDELAAAGGKLHPALLKALTDKTPARRAVAACIVGRVGEAEQKKAVEKLLKDKNAEVRLRAAQGLLVARNAASVSALIGLLTDTPQELAWQAEELLCWVAGDAGPEKRQGEKLADRRACRSAWEDWWQRAGQKIDWTSLEKSPRRPGLVLVHQRGAFSLYGCDGKVRRELPHSRTAPAWLWLPNRHLLTAQEHDRRMLLAEWDERGQQVWKMEEDATWEPPYALKQLPDGQVLTLSTRSSLTLDSQGKVLRRLPLGGPLHPLGFATCIDPWGRLAVLYGKHSMWEREAPDDSGIVVFDPATGKQVQTVKVESRAGKGIVGGFTALPGGQFLVALVLPSGQEDNRFELRRIDATGRPLWTVERPGSCPYSLRPLRNGNVLLVSGSPSDHYDHQCTWVQEVDSSGRLVWEAITPWNPQRVPTTGTQVVYPLVRFGFSRLLGGQSLETPALRLAQLASKSGAIRKHGALRLTQLRLSRGEVRQASGYLLDRDKDVSRWIVRTFAGNKERVGTYAIPDLMRVLNNEAPHHVSEAALDAGTSLRAIGPDAARVLIAAAEDVKNPTAVRAAAARALGHWIDEPQSQAAGALRRLFRDGNREVRLYALLGVCKHKEAARPWVPELAKLLDEKDSAVARDVLFAFSYLHRGADRAMPYYVQCLARKDVQDKALFSLHDIGRVHPSVLRGAARDLLPALLKLLKPENDPFIIAEAAEIVGYIGPAAKAAVPTMIGMLQACPRLPASARDQIRNSVAMGLGGIGPDAKAAVPALLSIAEDVRVSNHTLISVVISLGKIGPAAKAAVPMLKLIPLSWSTSDLHAVAVEAIRAIESASSAEAEERSRKRYPSSPDLPLRPLPQPPK